MVHLSRLALEGARPRFGRMTGPPVIRYFEFDCHFCEYAEMPPCMRRRCSFFRYLRCSLPEEILQTFQHLSGISNPARRSGARADLGNKPRQSSTYCNPRAGMSSTEYGLGRRGERIVNRYKRAWFGVTSGTLVHMLEFPRVSTRDIRILLEFYRHRERRRIPGKDPAVPRRRAVNRGA